ncbi:MAG: proton-conducting transporter transmembrane domain-containing protein, partial [Alphaproteobacteria bacterium]
MDFFSIDPTFIAMAAPFLAAFVAPLLKRLMGANAAWLLALVPAAMFVHFCTYIPGIAANKAFINGVPWVWQIDVNFSYLIDGLSLMFALLITGIGTFIILYSGAYLKGHAHLGRFFSFMFLFMGSMLGLVLADDFITLFIYWELTSLTSFLLIGFDHTRMAARRAAIQALVITGGGGLALLAGLILMMLVSGLQLDGQVANSMSDAIGLGKAFADNPYYLPVLILILGGAFTKSAQFPFHSWLPNAMEAPTPVSAYLHSATMVKAGVYLLMRVHPFLGDTVAWSTILPFFGAITLIGGALLAIRQTDLKLILAYTTVASLGLLVMLIGTSLPIALYAAVTYLFAHALFKGGLFMIAGALDHEAGTRDITALGGLRRAMPISFISALLAAWSMAGLPLALGFFAKETMYDGLLHGSGLAAPVLIIAIIGNALMMAAGFAVALKPFTGPAVVTPKAAHQGPLGLWIGALVLAVGGILAILAGGWTGANIIGPANIAVTLFDTHLHVSPALHINTALFLSLGTWVLGILAYSRYAGFRSALQRIFDRIGWGPDRGFDQVISGLTIAAAAINRRIQTGNLEHYVFITFVVVALTLLVPQYVFGEWPSAPLAINLTFYEWAIMALAIIGLAAVITAKNRLIAIVSLGIQGFTVAILFMLFGAPDLSFTQFMVETLSVVILALVMTRLSLLSSDRRSALVRTRDAIVAIACGTGFASVLIGATSVPFNNDLSAFFAQYSRT